VARPPVSAKTVSQPDHSSRGDGQREPGFGAHHPRPRPPHRRGETRTRVTRVVRAGRSSSIWDISIYFASQNALCVTPRANAAIDARFMNGDRQVRPKPTLLGKPGRSECMVRPLAGLSPRGVAHDRGHHAPRLGRPLYCQRQTAPAQYCQHIQRVHGRLSLETVTFRHRSAAPWEGRYYGPCQTLGA